MNKNNLPALLITWNRPNHLIKSYKAILESGVSEIYIYNDGPSKVKEINKKIFETRNLINKLVMEYEFVSHKIFFSDVNSSGCKNGVYDAITWFFKHNEKGLIIEDDVIISDKFPLFCKHYFSQSKDIEFISACNYGIKPSNKNNFRLSRHAYIWGWATTANLWSKYNKFIDESRIKNLLRKSKQDKIYSKYIKFICNKCKLTNKEVIDTWDYQLSFLLLEQNILNLVPRNSLSENIGFDKNATHTKEKRPSYAKNISNKITLDKNIDINLIDFKADKKVERLIYIPSFSKKLIKKIFKWLNINQ